MVFKRLRDGLRKSIAVYGESSAGWKLVGIGRAHDQGAGEPHFLVQEADGIVLPVVGPEGVRADEFGQRVGIVRVGAAHRAHFVQHHWHTALRRLPRRLAARESAADDVNGVRQFASYPGSFPAWNFNLVISCVGSEIDVAFFESSLFFTLRQGKRPPFVPLV